MGLLVVICRVAQLLFLGGGYGFLRAAELMAGLGANLDEYQGFLVPGDDVYLPVGAAVVAFQYLVAALGQEVPGQLLSQYSGLAALHLWSTSLTGRKERRWMGEGPIRRRQERCRRVP